MHLRISRPNWGKGRGDVGLTLFNGYYPLKPQRVSLPDRRWGGILGFSITTATSPVLAPQGRHPPVAQPQPATKEASDLGRANLQCDTSTTPRPPVMLRGAGSRFEPPLEPRLPGGETRTAERGQSQLPLTSSSSRSSRTHLPQERGGRRAGVLPIGETPVPLRGGARAPGQSSPLTAPGTLAPSPYFFLPFPPFFREGRGDKATVHSVVSTSGPFLFLEDPSPSSCTSISEEAGDRSMPQNLSVGRAVRSPGLVSGLSSFPSSRGSSPEGGRGRLI